MEEIQNIKIQQAVELFDKQRYCDAFEVFMLGCVRSFQSKG